MHETPMLFMEVPDMAQQQKINPPIKFRLAKCPDARALANLHYVCSREQPDGFMYQLGRKFLTTYYRIILHNKSSMVICAEAGDAGIVGLISATIEAAEELKALRDGRFRLLLSALPALIRQPKLISSVSARANSLSVDENGKGFVIGSGARLSFWGWSPDYPSQGQPTRLLRTALKLLKTLGVETVRTEIDRNNRKVIVLNRLMGGKVIEEFETEGGRKRIFMEHQL